MKRTLRAAVAAITLAGAVSVGSFAGTAGATNIGNEGCTPGYWKNHTLNWEEYQPTSLVKNNFTIPENLTTFVGKMTFLKALQGGGGPGINGAAKILLRAAVAAFLNAAHEGVGYPYRRFDDPFEIQDRVNKALAGTRQQMLDLAKVLDEANNLGCPLN